MSRWLACLALLLSAMLPVHAEVLNMVVPSYPPYTTLVRGKAGGIGVEAVQKIFAAAGLDMRVKVVSNYSRCIVEVGNGSADGFFLASRNAERDAVAVLSQPVMQNQWVWVSLRDSALNPTAENFKRIGTVGAVLSSNPHVWLRQNGYAIRGTPITPESLLSMLEARRFDAALAPALVIQHVLREAGQSSVKFVLQEQLNQDFGIYIAKHYLAKHPGFMEKLNEAIARQ